MKKFLIALIFCCSVFSLEAQAESYSEIYKKCMEEKVPVKLNLRSSFGKLVYDKTKTSREISRIASNRYNPQQKLLGLAAATTIATTAMKVESFGYNGEYACVIPTEVDVFFGYKNPVIYISKEAQRSRCREKQVTRHEQTHMQINILALDYFLPQVKAIALKRVQELDPFVVDMDSQNIREEMQRVLDPFAEKMQNLAEQIHQYLQEEQGKLDNDENYMFESTVCPD